MNTIAVAKFISTLFASRDQAHIFHLQTGSYAAHKALNEYYDGIVGLADDYVETYQGRYGILMGYTAPMKYAEGDAECLQYFLELAQFIETFRGTLPPDTDLNNIVDEISALVRTTIYKLKFLK